MFKTARFKVHNPSRHKTTMLWYAMTGYHQTLKRILEAALANPDFPASICSVDKKGRNRPNKFMVGKLLRTVTPKGWMLAPLRDYLIHDAEDMLMSHLSKEFKGKHESNPPTVPRLEGLTDEEYRLAYSRFATSDDFPPKPQHQDKIDKARALGHTRVAERLEKIYSNWAVSRAAGDILRKIEGAMPHPIEFRHAELERGCLLARRGNDYFALIRLFSPDHSYWKQTVLADDFIDWRTREHIGGKKYPGLILPLELGREYHEQEYLEQGRPQSAKLVARTDENGTRDFYVHVAFEFKPAQVEPQTLLGIDLEPPS